MSEFTSTRVNFASAACGLARAGTNGTYTPPPVNAKPQAALRSQQQFPHLPAQLLGGRLLGRLGDDADDGLGVAGPHVHPAVRPVETQSVDAIGLRLRPALDERRVEVR